MQTNGKYSRPSITHLTASVDYSPQRSKWEQHLKKLSSSKKPSDENFMLKIELEHYKKLYRDLLVKYQKERKIDIR